MNILLNKKAYEVEIIAYLKVFYPLEDIKINEDEQPMMVIDVKQLSIRVAYFDGEEKKRLSGQWLAEFQALEGKEQDRLGKSCVKRLLFELCGQATGIVPPWGILLGIRPTKLAFKLLESTGDVSMVEKVLIEDYYVAKEKVNLLLEVIKVEDKYVHVNHNLHSVYIGIPFCPTRCSYCSFTSYPKEKHEDLYNKYTDRLIYEMTSCKKAFVNIRSVYIGGGTPTSLGEKDFRKLLKVLRDLMGPVDVEFTVEAGRPDSITYDKLLAMKDYGVNRISINPQTAHNKTLAAIGREHSYEDVVEAYKMARRLGFKHINMDLILGLPGETPLDTNETIKKVINLGPESITVHTMALKRGSKLSDDKKTYLSEMNSNITSMLEGAQSQLNHNGYHAYYLYRQKNMVGNFENVGYCVDGKESIYNIHTMEEKKESIVAFGAGSISKKRLMVTRLRGLINQEM